MRERGGGGRGGGREGGREGGFEREFFWKRVSLERYSDVLLMCCQCVANVLLTLEQSVLGRILG